MKKAILALIILAAIMVSCNTERHCRPEFMSGYGDTKKDYK